MLSNHTLRFLFKMETEFPYSYKIFLFCKNKIESDFGKMIANKCTPDNFHTLANQFYSYSQHIRSAIEALDKIEPRDIMDLLNDINLGQGKIMYDLVKLLLTKDGTLAACLYRHQVNGSAMEAATQINQNCADLMLATIRENNPNQSVDDLLQPPLVRILSQRMVIEANSEHEEDEIDLIHLTSTGQHKQLADIFQNRRIAAKQELGENAEEEEIDQSIALYCSTIHDSRQSTLLHAAALSGSIETLELVAKNIRPNIQNLYYRNTVGRTPAYYAIHSGSLLALQFTLKLSTLAPHAECLPDVDMPQVNSNINLLDLAIEQNNLVILDYLLQWLKENNYIGYLIEIYSEERASLYHTVNRINRILLATSGAMFHLLNNYVNFTKNSELMKLAARMENTVNFTTRCLIKQHLKKLERLEQEHNAQERPNKRRRI